MAAKKIRDLAVKTGEYQDRNGQAKGRYENVGSLFKSDDGSIFLMLKRTFNPAGVPDLSGKGGDSILIGAFELKQQDGQQQPVQQAAPQRQAAPTVEDDDIPF